MRCSTRSVPADYAPERIAQTGEPLLGGAARLAVCRRRTIVTRHGDMGCDQGPPQRAGVLRAADRRRRSRRILEAGRRAPSSKNWQPWDLVVVTERALLIELARVWRFGGSVAQSAATVALIGPVLENEMQNGWLWFDCGQAMMSMLIEAADLGIGSGHSAVQDQALLRALLGVPEDRFGVALMPLGYPRDRPLAPIENPKRRPFERSSIAGGGRGRPSRALRRGSSRQARRTYTYGCDAPDHAHRTHRRGGAGSALRVGRRIQPSLLEWRTRVGEIDDHVGERRAAAASPGATRSRRGTRSPGSSRRPPSSSAAWSTCRTCGATCARSIAPAAGCAGRGTSASRTAAPTASRCRGAASSATPTRRRSRSTQPRAGSSGAIG